MKFRHSGSSSLPPGVFACGLSVVWGERTHPVREWEGLIFRPTLFPERAVLTARSVFVGIRTFTWGELATDP